MESVISEENVAKDIDAILWSTRLAEIYRFTNQRFWERESVEHEHAMRIEAISLDGSTTPRAESVAEHSWHIADIVLIIGPRFPNLDLGRCLMLAILHDKLEIIIGDKSPLGRDGKGTNTHAFNEQKKLSKDELETEAIIKYKKRLNEYAQGMQEDILLDTIKLNSVESKFVKALDKLHPLTYIIRKKRGHLTDDHINFTLKYSGTYLRFFPGLKPYYDELVSRLFIQISEKRQMDKFFLMQHFFTEQLNLF